VHHYLSHEEERRAIVTAARTLVLERHTWAARAKCAIDAKKAYLDSPGVDATPRRAYALYSESDGSRPIFAN